MALPECSGQNVAGYSNQHVVALRFCQSTYQPHRTVTVDLVWLTGGLHNPLLLHGGLPVIDGVVTSPNSAAIVRFNRVAVPWLVRICSATGSCDLTRGVITGTECAYKQARHWLAPAGSHTPVCKWFRYVDGLVCQAGTCSRHRPADDRHSFSASRFLWLTAVLAGLLTCLYQQITRIRPWCAEAPPRKGNCHTR